MVELLVVVGIIAVLISILLPTLSGAYRQAQTVQCASNLRQLVLASLMYCNDNDGFLPEAEADGLTTNLQRWIGSRPSTSAPFDFNRDPSPLKQYLLNGAIRACPSLPQEFLLNGDDTGAGGYGYVENNIGSSLCLYPNAYGPPDYAPPPLSAYTTAAKWTQIRRSSAKIIFADTAFAYDMTAGKGLYQYSFVEEPFSPGNYQSWPSIHFRHNNGAANIAWVDGHVTTEPFGWTLSTTDPSNWYHINFAAVHLGWIGPQDDTLFQRN